MNRLVIASNRVVNLDGQTQSGGLAVAVEDALRSVGGLWFGWDGKIVEDSSNAKLAVSSHGRVKMATIPMTEQDYQEYYLGFSNRVLWPVCHYRLDLVQFEPAYFEGYKRVNQKFAKSLRPLLLPDDLVWVHDYHLMALASELRELGATQRIGFFLHIPFPPPELLHAIPVCDALMRALFEYDVIGFQTRTDLNNFRRFVSEHAEGGAVLYDSGVRAYGRTIVAREFPIGIDVKEFSALAAQPEASEQIESLSRRGLVRSLMVGVDRLDYTKGLPERFKAFRRLLELYPEHRKKVTLLQIAPPTRAEVEAYANIREELEGLSGAINGEFGDLDWMPVHCINRASPRETLAALFRNSEVGLVTPLRDGMNLVAKEYVAAQDERNPGVLVLSRFAGAAEEMQEALIVNPYDIDEMASVMHDALLMPLKERKERHAALLKTIKSNDVRQWRENFLQALAERVPEAAA